MKLCVAKQKVTGITAYSEDVLYSDRSEASDKDIKLMLCVALTRMVNMLLQL